MDVGFVSAGVAAMLDAWSAPAAGLAAGLVIMCFLMWRRSVRFRREGSRLRGTLDSIGAPVLVTDQNLSIVDANRTALEMLGLRRRSPRRIRLLDRVTPADGTASDEIVEQLRKHHTTVYEAAVLVGEEEHHVRVRINAVDGSDGTRHVVLLEDVSTERTQAAHYERFLDYLIQNAPAEVSILSPDGRYQYLSSSFIVDERRRQWLLGKTDFDYCRESGLHTEIALRRRSHRMEAIDRREAVFFDEEIVLEGVERHLSWRYVPFFGEEDEVMMVLGFGLDRTDLVRCRKELHDAEKESAKATRLKDSLLQNVTHEVRTPLSGIIGTAQMLRSEVDPAVREFIENIEENAQRLSRTLTDMLDLAGLQAQVTSIAPAIVELTHGIENVVRSLRPEADRRGLFLEFAASEPEIFVRVDREALERCASNLIENALKFTSEGGVAVDVSQRDAHAFIRVMDTGVGIGRAISRDVFEAFQQEQAGLDRSFEGAGLGLAVTERMVSAMGGEIRVHSRKGSGSSFVIRLPLLMPSLRRGPKPRVLVADPHDETQRLVGHIFRDLADVRAVLRTPELSKLAADRPFDVVLVDARFDDTRPTGEVADLMRSIPSVQQARLVLTDHDVRSARRRAAVDAGWDDLVAKPLAKVDLLNVVFGDMSSLRPERRMAAR